MLTREQFSKWWADSGSSSVQTGKALARGAWDAAIRAAVVLLDDEVNRWLNSRQYELAALTRDCRELVEGLFTTPGQWNVGQRQADKQVEDWMEIFRRLSPEQLDEVRRVSKPDSPQASALRAILAEQSARKSSSLP